VNVGSPLDIHRIGGGTVENLRLKPQEAALEPPGISVLQAPAPDEAARQLREAFPGALRLHKQANVVGSTNEAAIRAAGFELVHAPTSNFPNHYRITHPDGAEGFNDVNLARLAAAFADTTGH
jgi:hypothetical protein